MDARYQKRFFLQVAASGLTSITTQIILLRQFMVIFYGNELIMGVILANWMLLTGFGSYLGRFSDKIKNQPSLIFLLLVMQAALPIVTVFLLNDLRNIIFPVGRMIGVIEVFYSSIILLLPLCLVSGFLFTLFCSHAYRYYTKNLTGKVYGFESMGSIIGGVLFNVIFVFYLNTFQSLLILLTINLLTAFFYSLLVKGVWKYILVPLTLLCIGLVIYFDPDDLVKKRLYINQDVLYQKETPFGNIVVTKTEDQINFYENGLILFSSNNTIESEESVHYGMIQHPDPKNVLILSGGISGTLNELLKYRIDSVDYIEMNPWIIKTSEKFLQRPDDKRISIINEDPRLFLRKTGHTYDVVLINLPEPTTAQINRYYTSEFFRELSLRLNPCAVVSTSLASTANYMSPEQQRIQSVFFNTLHSVFKNILIVPGGKNYFLSSDCSLDIHIAEHVRQKELDNKFVNAYYIVDSQLKDRSDQIMASLDKASGLNRDFKPVSYLQQLLLWLSYFKVDYRIPLAIIIVLMILVIVLFNATNLGMFAGGFAASSLEFLILIAFQVIYGYVYQMTGVIITVFMAGLAVGSLVVNRYMTDANQRNYRFILFGIALYSFLLPLALQAMNRYNLHAMAINTFFIALTLIISILTGMLFAQASVIRNGSIGKTSGTLYSADMLGSAFGVLIVSSFLLPWLGIIKVCFIIGLLNVLAGSGLLIRKNRILR
jgi:spermidine synthase